MQSLRAYYHLAFNMPFYSILPVGDAQADSFTKTKDKIGLSVISH